MVRERELSKDTAECLFDKLATLVSLFFAAMTSSAAMISARLSRGRMFTSACSTTKL